MSLEVPANGRALLGSSEEQLAETLKENRLLHFHFERSGAQLSPLEYAELDAELKQSDALLAEKTKIARD
jgi:hypothetical protein